MAGGTWRELVAQDFGFLVELVRHALGEFADRAARAVAIGAARVDLRGLWQPDPGADELHAPAGVGIEREQTRIEYGKAGAAARAGAPGGEKTRGQRHAGAARIAPVDRGGERFERIADHDQPAAPFER